MASPHSSAAALDDLEIDDLEKLLLAAEEIEEPSAAAVVAPTTATKNSSDIENLWKERQKKNEKPKSTIHNGDTDSSDDEEIRNFLERKYDEYGRGVNNILKQKEDEKIDHHVSNFIDRTIRHSMATEKNHHLSQNFKAPLKTVPQPESSVVVPTYTTVQPFQSNVYTDPIFGLRMSHPLVSSAVLKERMEGRKAVHISSVRNHTEHGDMTQDWAIAGVLVSKSPTKTTQKGGQYSIWKLSDLRGEIKMVTLFLFQKAYKELWKTAEGMVLGILNPGVMDRKDEKSGEAVLSVDTPIKVMVLGQSKDLGTCKSRKKNGDKCTAIVNMSQCEYCVYHVKQEYNKASVRGGIISSTGGRGLNELRNKVLGKSEVFYAGQSFSAIPAKKNAKYVEKDSNRMMTLSTYYQSPFQGEVANTSVPSYRQPSRKSITQNKGSAAGLEINVKQREKDVERLNRLKALAPAESAVEESDVAKAARNKAIERLKALQPVKRLTNPRAVLAPAVDSKFENKTFSFEAKKTPKLSTGNFTIDLNVTNKQSNAAKIKALAVLQKKPMEKSNPNFIKHRGTALGKKRALEDMIDTDENTAKKQRLEAEEAKKDRIKKIMEASSSHTDLVEAYENDEQEKYFKDLERKEAMEEKMMNTFKLDCKAVICQICKYIAFSASDKCKAEGHPLTIKDAEKRFFKCLDCSNRTVTLHRLPKVSCKNCQSSRWERCAMMRDKKGPIIGNQLSIRGNEESFIGSLSATANISLLVPMED